MEKANNTINFNQVVQEVEEEKILLPDFQRKFSWTSREIQGKLVASVICKMPIGSILLLDLPAKEYAVRRIGSNSAEEFLQLETNETRQFLLDGQQRITVIVNAFSNLIHEKGVTRIDSLKRRFFLGVAKPRSTDKYERDYWGLKKLRFPMAVPGEDIPVFMTDDIAQTIVIKEFLQKDKVPFNPYYEGAGQGLPEYCCTGDEEYYLIPLYLLVHRTDANMQRKNRRMLQDILELIAHNQVRYLEECFEELPTKEEKMMWLNELLETEEKQKLEEKEELEEIAENHDRFSRELKGLQREWTRDMEYYLDSCMNNMNLHIMGVPGSQRAKAIEVFENLNRGGVKLSTFDLVVARAARDNHNFTRALDEECSRQRTYPLNCVPDRIREYCKAYMERRKEQEKRYSALCDTGCVGECGGDYPKIFQDTFLNVLALKCHDEKHVGSGFENRNYHEEMSRDSILRLSSREINENYACCCAAVDRAAFFLKARCGIRSITEVNYQLMMTVLSYLFLQEEIYQQEKNWNLLTAWYWCAVFSGRYDKDQNAQAARDLKTLKTLIQTGRGCSYIRELQKQAWDTPFFSDKSFLLYEKSEETHIYPKEVLGRYICQFYLSLGYTDMLREDLTLCSFMQEETAEIEKHHMIPILSAQNIRESEKVLKCARGEKCLINSPLNLVYVTKKANQFMAAKDLDSYLKYLQGAAISALDFPAVPERIRESDIRMILGERFEKLRNRLAECVNGWLAGWA